MASFVYHNGEHRDVLPLINDGTDWQTCIPWVFSNDMWRRTIDPGFVNLITNSRMIHGTDISVSQGKISGFTPVGWTLGTMTTGSSYSASNFTQEEQVKSVRFVSEQSRHYYITRVQVEAGNIYSASAFIEQIGTRNQRKVLAIVGESASIEIDVDFPISKEIKLGQNCIQFYARTSGTVQLRVGAGVDAAGDADVTISRPQITRSFEVIEWQPTPIVAPFYGINMVDSYLTPSKLLTYSDGEYSLDVTLRVENRFSRPVMLFGRNESQGFSGIGFDEHSVYVYRDGYQDRFANLSKPIPTKRLIGLKVIWRKSGNYVSDIRFYLNSELIGRIPSSLYSGNIDSVFGYEQNRSTNLTIQSFNIKLNKLLAYNVDEGQGNIIEDRNNDITMKLFGDEHSNFIWVSDMSPPIIIVDTFDQSATIGEQVRFYADATFYLTAQWYHDDVAIPNANSSELTINSVTENDFGVYYCEFQNEFGKTRTSSARLKDPNDHTLRISTEDGMILTTEDDSILITEV